MFSIEDKLRHDLYQKYLEEKHRDFKTPRKVIDTMVEKATGSKPNKRRRIIEGEVNEVYDITTKNKQNIVVRISRSGTAKFEAEEKAIKLVLTAGVPAPKVLLIEQTSSKPEKLAFCIEEKIEGESLKTLMGSLNKNNLKPIISEAGEILSKINSITVDGFGNLAGAFYKTWEDYIFELEERKDRIIQAGKTIDIKITLIDKAFRLLRENKKIFQLKEAKLLHGDFSPKHLLVKNNHIIGIIDFGGAKGGDPVQDFAWLDFFYCKSFLIDWLKEGYNNKALFDDDFNLKMKLYRLHMELDFLDYYASEKNKSGMNYSKDRFLTELKNF